MVLCLVEVLVGAGFFAIMLEFDKNLKNDFIL